jgi:hypothetical protein
MESILTTNQKKIIEVARPEGKMVVQLRYDDECGNGHNTFSMTATLYSGRREDGGGCCHDEITKYRSDLIPYVKWHLCSSNGPLHYLANSLYLASDKDHYGYRKGEPCRWEEKIKFGDFPMLFTVDKAMRSLLKSDFNWSKAEIEEFQHPKGSSYLKPQYRVKGYEEFAGVGSDPWYKCSHSTRLELEQFIECCQKYPVDIVRTVTDYSDGKTPELEAARNAAIWPNAELEDFTKEKLEARLPKLLEEFKADMESLGFTY